MRRFNLSHQWSKHSCSYQSVVLVPVMQVGGLFCVASHKMRLHNHFFALNSCILTVNIIQITALPPSLCNLNLLRQRFQWIMFAICLLRYFLGGEGLAYSTLDHKSSKTIKCRIHLPKNLLTRQTMINENNI